MNVNNNVHVPLEALHNIFSFLELIERFKIQSVCRTWLSASAKDLGKFVLNDSRRQIYNHRPATDYFLVKGKEMISNTSGSYARDDTASVKAAAMKRTKGHLPEPLVMTQSSAHSKLLYHSTKGHSSLINTETADKNSAQYMNCMQMHECTYRNNVQRQIALAIQFQQCIFTENTYNKRYITHLDLSTNYWGYKSDHWTLKGKNSILVIDLTNLNLLERLSVKGCSKLHTLRMPHSLHALDASACASLVEISTKYENAYNNNQSQIDGDCMDETSYKLKALNLNGCRSLTHASFLSRHFLHNVEELDLTSATKLSKSLMETALRNAHHLKNVSLRYIAVDGIIDALSTVMEDVKAKDLSGDERQLSNIHSRKQRNSSLTLVDLAFSDVTDNAVEKMVNNCTRLERCNLRGCKNVSGHCYNQAPIYLSQRKCVEDQGSKNQLHDFSIDYGDIGDGKRRRKGDNIFYFTK